MMRSARKIIRSAVTAAVLMMIAVAGCKDGNVVIKRELDRQLINSGIDGEEVWKIVCAMPPSGQGCNPVSTRAIAFNSNGTAITYDINGTSWSRAYQVLWYTERDILYITYGDNTGVRYTFGIIDGLLTLRNESSASASGISGYLTNGSSLAGFEKASLPVFPVNFNTDANGTVSVRTQNDRTITSGAVVPLGTDLTITPVPKTGYFWSTLTVNDVPFVSGARHRVTAAVDIAAQFKPRSNPVSITAFPETGGALSVTTPDGAEIDNGMTVLTGTVLKVTAAPKAGHILSTLTFNGEQINSGDTRDVDTTVTIIATFSIPGGSGGGAGGGSHPVSIFASAGGTLSVKTLAGRTIGDGEMVEDGANVRVTATANSGHTLSSLTLNGRRIDNNETHTVNGALMVRAEFTGSGGGGGGGSGGSCSGNNCVTAKLTRNPPAGGVLSVRTLGGTDIEDDHPVEDGTVVKVTVTESPGYRLSSLTMNGRQIISGSEETVSGELNVVANFEGGPDVPDVYRSIKNTIDTTTMTPEVRARYNQWRLLGSDYLFNNVWWLDDEETRFDYPKGSGNMYANNGVFAPNGRFLQVAIQLDKDGVPEVGSIAYYMDIGTWKEVGGRAIIEIKEAKLSDKVESSYTSPITIVQRADGDVMSLTFKGKSHIFKELHGIIFKLDENMFDALLSSPIFD